MMKDKYCKMSNEKLQRIALVRFGNSLKSIDDIGREAVIEELKSYDRFLIKLNSTLKGDKENESIVFQ